MKIDINQNVMSSEIEFAERIRENLKANSTTMLNLIGSPGCGKTTLLEKTASLIQEKLKIMVLEGDIETTRDADRLKAAGVCAHQLVTKGTCYLSANLVYQSISGLSIDEFDIIIVENVGNLVCPAEFSIGEHNKVVILSVTEGEDKPLKYPAIFLEAGACVITKTDLLPHLSYSFDSCIEFIKQVNPRIPVFPVSATNGQGMKEWIQWLCDQKQSS